MNNKYEWKNVTVLPAIFQNLSSVLEVNNEIMSGEYDFVCIEYPSYLQKAFTKLADKINQLYLISVLPIGKKVPVFFPVIPNDPFAMACFLASRQGLPIRLIDLEIPKLYDYTVSFKKIGERPELMKYTYVSKEDNQRMAFMKKKLTQYSAVNKKILFICHYPSFATLVKTLEDDKVNIQGLSPNIPKQLRVFNIHPDGFHRVSFEIPFLTFNLFSKLIAFWGQKLEFDEYALVKKKLDGLLVEFSQQTRENFFRYLNRLNEFGSQSATNKLDNVLKAVEALFPKEIYEEMESQLTFCIASRPSFQFKTIYFKSVLENPFNISASRTLQRMNSKKDSIVESSNKLADGQMLRQEGEVFLLEKKLYELMKYIKRRVYNEVSRKPMEIAYPLIIFSNYFDIYAHLKRSFHFNSKVNLLFYSRSIDSIYEDDSDVSFMGGICFSSQPLFPYKKPKIKKNYHYYFLDYQNSSYRNTIIPYISLHPPSERFVKQMKDRGNYVYYIPIREIPQETIFFFKSIHSLGHYRIQNLLNKRKSR